MSNRIYARRQLGSPSVLAEKRVSIENQNFNLNDPEAFRMLTNGTASATGIPINHKTAMKVAVTWQCVKQISGDISKLHMELKRISEDGQAKNDKKHPSWRLVRRRWNDETPASRGWRTIIMHALLWGDGYAFIDRNGRGDGIGIYNLLPDRVTPLRVDGKKFYQVTTERPDGSPWQRMITADDIMHITDATLDGIGGLDFVEYARDALGAAVAAERLQGKYFKSGIVTGGILELPKEMSEPAREKVEKGFAARYAGEDNWFKTVVLRDNAKFHAAQSTMREAQMVELDEGLVRKIARFFNIAPSRVGLSDSVSYNSKAEDNQSYLDTTLSPWLTAIAAECWMKLLSVANQDDESHEFVHDVSQLLRLNRLQRYQIYSIGRRSRILSPNDCRRDDGLPPVEGEDSLDVVPTSIPAAGQGDAVPPRGKADPSGGQAPAGRQADQIIEKRRLTFAIADRARVKAESSTAFIAWIDGGLKSYRTSAKARIGSEAIVDEFVIGLRAIAEKASESQLVAEVEKFVTQKEVEA